MPELPEVETIRLGLQKHLVGQTIEKVDVRLKKMLTGDISYIVGAQITSVERFGKGLVINLDNGYAIAIHIKMTGQLIYRDATIAKSFHPSLKIGGTIPNKFTHVIFTLKGKSDAMLYYNDIRQFGWMKIIKRDELKELSFFKELGPEPLKDLTEEMLGVILLKSKGPIKPLLMDQKKIGGIGNIYANEALFQAKIDPRRKANTLSETELAELFAAIEFVLKKSLSYGGASEVNFVNVLGEDGGYQHHFLVYARENEPCLVCQTAITKIRQAGRGTFFCTVCQRL